MKLDELTRPPLEDAFAILRGKGYEQIGAGQQAWVWAKPGADTVLKLFKAQDRAYWAFANLTKTHPNPHFPHLFGKVIRVTQFVRAVRMERLAPLPDDRIDDARALETYLDYPSFEQYSAHSSNPDMAKMEWQDVVDLFHREPNLKVACDLILYNLGHWNMDLHSKNVMTRGEMLVLTDPVW